MKATDIKVKNFASNSYGIFEDGKFITVPDGWDEMIERATMIANEGVSKCTIATLKFAGCQMTISKSKRGLRRNGLKYIEKRRMFYKLLSKY